MYIQLKIDRIYSFLIGLTKYLALNFADLVNSS